MQAGVVSDGDAAGPDWGVFVGAVHAGHLSVCVDEHGGDEVREDSSATVKHYF